MTMDGLQLERDPASYDRARFFGAWVIALTLTAPAFTQDSGANHRLRVAHLHGAPTGYVPDRSCEPLFQGGDCSEYNYCMSLWDDYCHQRQPRHRLSCRQPGHCYSVPLQNSYSHLPPASLQRPNHGTDVIVGSPAPTSKPLVQPSEPAPAQVKATPQLRRSDSSRSQPTVPLTPNLSEKPSSMTAPVVTPPDHQHETSEPTAPVVPPDPAGLPDTAPVPQLPKNQLPASPVSVALQSMIEPVTDPISTRKIGHAWQRGSQQPPIPIMFESQSEVTHAGTARLIEYLQEQYRKGANR